MSRNEEGNQARRRLMAGDDPEKAAAAAFELGVYYMDEAGGEEEAELCIRSAIATNHPLVLPAALLSLAVLLQRVKRFGEAAQTYRTVMALRDPTTLVMATYGLGALLSGGPEHMEEGESFLLQAADSNDPEYGPLASYDLGVLLSKQPGRLSEALAALAHAAASNHAEYAPRALFNSGVLLAAHGALKEAESAFCKAIASNDQNIAPMAAVNLGGLLDSVPERDADAEAAYRFAIDSEHPEQKPLAFLGLANLLAQTPGRQAESEAAYRNAMLSPDSRVAAGAAYNLGVMLLADPSRHADAEGVLRVAAVSCDPEHGPIAMYNLGRLLAEEVDRWDDARLVLEAAIHEGDPRVVGPATNLLSNLDVSQMPERLIPIFKDKWNVTRVFAQGAYYLEEYLPAWETANDWTAIVTVTQIASPSLTPKAYVDAIRQNLEGNVIDGHLSLNILEQTETELIYESEIADDVAQLDQNEVTRIVRRNERLYTIQHAIRGDLSRAREERPARVAFLRAAGFKRVPAPAPIVPTADEKVIGAILKQLVASATMLPVARVAFCRDSLKQASKDSSPQAWATLNLQLALALIQQASETAPSDDDLGEVAVFLRRALEVYKPENDRDLWGRALAALGRIKFAEARRHDQSDEAAEKELAKRSLSHAIAAFETARAAFDAGTYDWARITADLGDARLSVDVEAAAATYTEMLSKVENMPPLTDEDQASDLGGALGEVAVRAVAGLQSIDRLKSGEPVAEREVLETEKRGQVLYLRPLLSAGHLQLRNQCLHDAFRAGYRSEADNITLEALLYRAIAVEMNFISLGGRPEDYGATRMIMAAGGTEWQSTLKLFEQEADLILMVPHLSEGVRWEVELLCERRSLGKTLFVMPPLATDVDVPRLWAEASPMMSECGLDVPLYQPDGNLFSFGPDGKVAQRWEFGLLWKNELLNTIAPLLSIGAPPRYESNNVPLNATLRTRH